MAWQGRAGQGRVWQGRAGQGRARQGRAGRQAGRAEQAQQGRACIAKQAGQGRAGQAGRVDWQAGKAGVRGGQGRACSRGSPRGGWTSHGPLRGSSRCYVTGQPQSIRSPATATITRAASTSTRLTTPHIARQGDVRPPELPATTASGQSAGLLTGELILARFVSPVCPFLASRRSAPLLPEPAPRGRSVGSTSSDCMRCAAEFAAPGEVTKIVRGPARPPAAAGRGAHTVRPEGSRRRRGETGREREPQASGQQDGSSCPRSTGAYRSYEYSYYE